MRNLTREQLVRIVGEVFSSRARFLIHQQVVLSTTTLGARCRSRYGETRWLRHRCPGLGAA